MVQTPDTLTRRAVGEWTLTSGRPYGNPFTDVTVQGVFHGPQGQRIAVAGFYDGQGAWRVRFSPAIEGHWTYAITSWPRDPELEGEGTLDVFPSDARGYLRATPGEAWGFAYESGEPYFAFGDTTYNLFGMAHCGCNVPAFLQRRAQQGFNLLRVRLPVSPFHPPRGYSRWQTRRTWPWGGSEQSPRFDQFDLDYFHSVDAVIAQCEALGIGLEMIMEAWGFEFPFNSRSIFVPEWEELWLRYLLARYDAYNCVHFWTLMNEYEYYPNGDWHYKPVADRWAMRVGRWVKQVGGHGHIVSVHNGPREPSFGKRFAADPGAIDAVMFQEWGSRDEARGWLADGIEGTIQKALSDWPGSAIFAEWGYERNPAFELDLPGHQYCDEEHTRRGAWRGAFCGLGIIHGFENSWGPWDKLNEDQPGMADLLLVRRFFREVVPFERLRPAPGLAIGDRTAPGEATLALASKDRRLVAVYLPVGGRVSLTLPVVDSYGAQWYDPCSGESSPAQVEGATFAAPDRISRGHPQDWVLVLEH